MTSAKHILRKAKLCYTTDDGPGITRRRSGKGFVYFSPRGGRITKPSVLRRIEGLVIPPAWKDVWISPSPSGHIQATGRDDKGRKQYLYHPRWQEEANKSKFESLASFGLVLPRIRRRYRKALDMPDTGREKVLATVTALLEKTHIRIGNEPYAEENHSYGLTTLQKKHVDLDGCSIHFMFPGKSKKFWKSKLDHPRLCRAVRKCQELPGQQLFKYRNGDGRFHSISSQDVNEYIHGIAGETFTAKDFRTWHATVSAFDKLRRKPKDASDTEKKRIAAGVVKEIASELNNTAAVSKRYYIHPVVLEAYLNGTLPEEVPIARSLERARGLSPEEKETLSFLARRNGRTASA